MTLFFWWRMLLGTVLITLRSVRGVSMMVSSGRMMSLIRSSGRCTIVPLTIQRFHRPLHPRPAKSKQSWNSLSYITNIIKKTLELIAHPFPHYCILLFPILANKDPTVSHWRFLSLHKSTWVVTNRIAILGIMCAMVRSWCAWRNAAIGLFLCNVVCNHLVNGKWWTQIPSISWRPQNFTYHICREWKLSFMINIG